MGITEIVLARVAKAVEVKLEPDTTVGNTSLVDTSKMLMISVEYKLDVL